jgi:hypothetical protein
LVTGKDDTIVRQAVQYFVMRVMTYVSFHSAVTMRPATGSTISGRLQHAGVRAGVGALGLLEAPAVGTECDPFSAAGVGFSASGSGINRSSESEPSGGLAGGVSGVVSMAVPSLAS